MNDETRRTNIRRNGAYIVKAAESRGLPLSEQFCPACKGGPCWILWAKPALTIGLDGNCARWDAGTLFRYRRRWWSFGIKIKEWMPA